MDTSGYRPGGVRQVISLLQAAKLELEFAAEVEDAVAPAADGARETVSRADRGFDPSAAVTGFGVTLLTNDDIGRAWTESEERPRARQNVTFEMGFSAL